MQWPWGKKTAEQLKLPLEEKLRQIQQELGQFKLLGPLRRGMLGDEVIKVTDVLTGLRESFVIGNKEGKIDVPCRVDAAALDAGHDNFFSLHGTTRHLVSLDDVIDICGFTLSLRRDEVTESLKASGTDARKVGKGDLGECAKLTAGQGIHVTFVRDLGKITKYLQDAQPRLNGVLKEIAQYHDKIAEEAAIAEQEFMAQAPQREQEWRAGIRERNAASAAAKAGNKTSEPVSASRN